MVLVERLLGGARVSVRGMRRTQPRNCKKGGEQERHTCRETKLVEVRTRVAEARHIVDVQLGLVERFRATGEPTLEAEDALNTYASGLKHLEAYELKLREDAKAKKGETKKKR